MKRMQILLALLALLMLGYSANSRADDTDIYVDNATNSGVPNVLFVMYNGANMDADAGSSCKYTDGTDPSTGTSKTSGLLQCALVNAIASIKDGAVNIGIVVNNANSFDGQSQATTDTTLGGYHDLCNSSGNGGCIIRKLQTMDATGKASMTAFIKGLKQPNGGSTNASGINLKVNTNSADPTAAMQEAWAYYNGKIGGSGTNYANSVLQSGCQRNFIVYIGNSQKGLPSGAGDGGITAGQVGATPALLQQITAPVSFNPAICGSTTTVNMASGNNWADEWTRLMYTQDGGSSTQNGSVQNIVTYTVNINADACVTDTVGMMGSMAKNGGGKFFDTSSATDLATALGQILNEVQAVNSVFSSASLPVSVNAQGTYLNQIFLGMFRPDSSGNPRWVGNLKQYQFVKSTTGDLVLGDATGAAAISSANTGFISPNAKSYWTYKNTAVAPDDATTGGFFANDLKGATPSAFDWADGEVVEKGGVAQQLRRENLKATFTGAIASGTNPRRLYTYCPTGASCVADLTDPANEFSTANGGIASNAFGVDNSVPIQSIVRTGTTALVTTIGNHGFTVGQTVTIRNSNQGAYNINYTLLSGDVNSTSSFTIRNLPAETPTSPAIGVYTLTKAGALQFDVSSAANAVSRVASTTTASANDVVTVKTATAHTFNVGDTVQFSNALTGYPSPVTVASVAADRMSFTFSLPLSPTTGSYAGTATYQGSSATVINSASYVIVSGSNSSAVNTITVTTTSHPFHDGQQVALSGFKGSQFNATFKITKIDSAKFSFQWTGNISNNDLSSATGSTTRSASALTSVQNVTMQRTNDAASATINVTGATSDFFANGDTVALASNTAGFTPASGTATISCTSPCNSFSYTVPLAATPATVPAGTTVSIGAGTVTAISISRNAAGLVTVVAPVNTFATGTSVNVAAFAGPYASETEYLGAKTITCTVNPGCTTFTYSITVSPQTPATGTNMQAYSGTAAPDRDSLIKWMRGMDNQGDEKGPGNGVTVRPSIHGDVLHSRPLVINYGDTRGIVAFYGSNDGMFRAVNGNQTASIGSVPAGGEMWGLILPEHFPYFNRQRTNSPELRFPSTFLASAQPKNYFIDGPTGVYQKLKDNGTIDIAHMFITMRRGGRLMYGLDVSQPQSPTVLWRIDNTKVGFEELGQTWSRPRLTLLQNYANPVLIFGGGYDPGQDTQPPTTATMGRAIYIIDAVTGALVWSATPSCTTSATCKQTPGMTHPIPSDIAFVDRNNDGKIDKLYVGDLGGNVWRFDVSTADTATWTATKVAALGCDDGTAPAPLCAVQAGDTAQRAPRKFFFPPSVLTIKPAGTTGSYDSISLASGDREHPLKDTASASSYYVTDRFFTVKDAGTSLQTPSTANLTMSNLFNATSTAWDQSRNGFYMTFAAAEKAVNAPLAVNGTVFFATNKPTPDATCSANLGQAKAYGVDPFAGTAVNNILQGGGLPPSAVAGIVQITTGSGASATTTNEKFCIGCGISGSQLGGTNTAVCNSALENCNAGKIIPKNLRRTYWYKK